MATFLPVVYDPASHEIGPFLSAADTLPAASLGTGTADSSKYLAGDLTWKTAQQPIQFKDENSSLSTAGAITSINFTGAGVTASLSGTEVTVSITGGSGAPTSASYLTLGTDASLTDERVLAGTPNQIVLTDGGAGGNATLSLSNTLVAPGSVSVTSSLSVSTTNNVSTAGSTQGTATAITTDVNRITTSSAGQGVVLPANTVGRTIVVFNDTANDINVYPPVGSTIDNAAVNAAVIIKSFSQASYIAVTSTRYDTLRPSFIAGSNITITPGDGIVTISAAGGSGSPGGSNTQIQFNSSGTFAGDADFTWDPTTNDLILGGTDTGITLNGVTTEPPAPAAGTGHFYAKTIGGKTVPKWKGPSGLDYPLQASFWQNNIVMWSPTTATAGVWLGTAGSGAGTYTTQLPTAGATQYQAIKRARWANVVTTTNQVLGQRNTEAMYFRGSVAGQGGFFFFARCGFDVWTNGSRFFAGMHSATTVVSADPSALNNTVGFCVDAADNGLISFLTRGTAATKASTGLTIVSNKGYDLYIFCAPNSSQYTWRIVDINTAAEASGTATANLPTNTTMLTVGVLASNGALTPVTSTQLGVNRIYVETDY